ncbi:hypothetical protein DV702_04035 [Sporosarcina sp. PTS2304]|uniref:hypothetical protein n=1 Tax=Sporosarcina sp. PTS2304 TaxID=2283194 RepID=UPI000E0DE4C5|nr:hypothetical protein [Sporosarcina sp. PTS2304]AXH98972.1 hypothetical protein DV702_04035 [Sporosarcina sp. PTS2304]
MEQLIILVVMLALGSLFGKKKEQPEEKRTPTQQRPIHTQTKQVEPERTNAAPVKQSRSLKDLSRDLFDDIQKEFKDLQNEMEEPKQPQPSRVPQTEVFYPQQPPRPVKPATPARVERAERQPSRGRLHSERSTVLVEDSRILQEDLIPRNSKQVIQGIVFSEILGPPKAKR